MIRTDTQQISRAIRIALLLAAVFAAISETMAERLPIKIYTTSDGLVRDQINHITQDSRGFIWLCTTEGLSRFDGYRFVNYGRDQGLLSRRVNDFLETRSGVYWVATSEGLFQFKPDASETGSPDASQKFIAYYPSDSLSQRYIISLYEDRAGTVWCGTSNGLYRLDQINGQWMFSFVDIVHPRQKAPDTLHVQSIMEDRQGALWINTKAGLYRLRPDGASELYDSKEGLPVPNITPALLEDKDGRIWVGTTLGLYQLVADPQPGRSVVARVYETTKSLKKYNVNALIQSSDGRFWIGADDGLSEFFPDADGGAKLQAYTPANGLSDALITALAEDRDGNLWIGTEAGGAMKLTVNGFTTYQAADGLGGTRIGSIFESRAGQLCVINGTGSISGLVNNPGGRQFSAVSLSLPAGMTYWGWGWYQITFQDHTGEWWMSTGEGLVRYPKLNSIEQLANARPKAIYTTKDGLATNEIFRLFEDSRGDIWISSLGLPEATLTRWERATETFHRYSPADGIPRTAPSAFCEDAQGNLWIGFYDGDLLRYSDGRFAVFTKSNGSLPGFIRGLYSDRAGRLWIATADRGLERVDNPGDDQPRFISYGIAEGLSSNQATCITEDQWGKIYIGTGRGVNRLDPATGHIEQYTVADGLANNFINVSFRDHEGALWFGTLQGLSRLIPQPEKHHSPPPILINALRIAGIAQPISELGATTITWPDLRANQNQIQIDFVGLGLAAGESLRYQYMLEGADRNWSAPTDQRAVNYASLSPGSYRFLVRAVSADGTISQSPASVVFKILPPFWRRWWFIAIAALLVASVVFAFDRYRVARLNEIHAALTESKKLTEQLTAQRAELRKANRSLSLEAAVTGIITESNTLNDAAPRILRAVCDLADWEAGELWELDPQTRALRCVAVWHQEKDTPPGSKARSQDAAPLSGAELAGRVLESGEPVVVSNLAGDTALAQARNTNRAGALNAFGFPVLLGHEVLGVLKLFTRIKPEHDAELLEIMSTVGSHIGQLIDRKRAEEALRKSREERLAELERVRKRIATDLHDDIGSSLTQITILSEVAHQQAGRNDKQSQEPLARVIKISNELVDAMSDIVWAINPKKDHLSDLLQRMRRFASDIFTSRNIAFRFQSPAADNNIDLGANLRREIFLVFKETVNNVVKHSECARAEIEFHVDGDWIVLKVSDDGKGFDVAMAADAGSDHSNKWRGGNGIMSMQKRASEMGGEFKIVSRKGEGTTSTLKVPIIR